MIAYLDKTITTTQTLVLQSLVIIFYVKHVEMFVLARAHSYHVLVYVP